jgi:hypothetical protein
VPKITRFLGVALSASSPKSFDADQVSILTSVPVISDQNGNCEANKGSVFVDPGRCSVSTLDFPPRQLRTIKLGMKRATVALDKVSRIFLVKPHRNAQVELLKWFP